MLPADEGEIRMDEGDFILRMKGVSKSFSSTRALDDVRLDVRRGTVHALMGENGAGKSTLMKIIMGIHRADAGEMEFDGRKVDVNSPAEAMGLGITMIHQELNPEPHLTIAENIYLGQEITRLGSLFLDNEAMNAGAREILGRFNLKLNPKSVMSSLTVAHMQMVEIIRAVVFNAKAIIMDEPTSSLDAEETERLFRTIEELRAKGISIIYISHRMEEIFRICDEVSVFRDGKYIDTRPLAEVTRDQLISMMVGREIESMFPKTDVPIGEPVLDVRSLRGKAFQGVSFTVHEGEILGFSGLVGAGRSEIMRAICGIDPVLGGEIHYLGEKVNIRRPRDSIRRGIAMVSEDRKDDGLVLNRSIRENISLPNLWHAHKGPFISRRRENIDVAEICRTFTVKAAGLESPAFSLSGGNQQKVVLCKWLMENPRVMILDEPTRGIDVGAKAEIHRLMCEFARKGMAIILISSELPEIMGMSDRVIVVCKGRLNGEFLRKDIVSGAVTQEHILEKSFA